MKEAASAGFYDSPFGKYPRLQLVTVGELLAGREIEYPRTLDVTFKKAPRARAAAAKSMGLPLSEDEGFLAGDSKARRAERIEPGTSAPGIVDHKRESRRDGRHHRQLPARCARVCAK